MILVSDTIMRLIQDGCCINFIANNSGHEMEPPEPPALLYAGGWGWRVPLAVSLCC
jgi:hypothetical protein